VFQPVHQVPQRRRVGKQWRVGGAADAINEGIVRVNLFSERRQVGFLEQTLLGLLLFGISKPA
jgi:hypothetical protein